MPWSNTGAKPPKIMRLPSKGISGIAFIAGSLSIACQAASAVALSGHAIHENTTVSSSVAWTARWKSVTLPFGTSTPQVSTIRLAPWDWNSDQAALA